MEYPVIYAQTTSREQVDTFGGYDHNDRISEGWWYDECNLTSARYPAMGVRARRSAAHSFTDPEGILAKKALAWVDDGALYFNGLDISHHLAANGVTMTRTEKTMVSMGAYLVIWPDKVYFNTENFTDCGSMEASVTLMPSTSAPVDYTLCKQDGTAYEDVAVSVEAPTEPTTGALWMDTSTTPPGLKQYTADGLWTSIATTYVKIAATGIGIGFAVGDVVELSGCAQSDLDGSKLLHEVGADYLVITGILQQSVRQTSGTLIVARSVPELDFVTEAQNRLWGCFYGIRDGATVNEIYCCALGDFKNWERFQGLSTDSYRASVGTDGPWTGAITHLGYPIFFKENCLHKVYVSTSGAHQIVDTQCRGVQKGSHKSLQVVGEVLYYKSRTDVCAYDGSLPVSVSSALGNERYSNAVAGSIGERYYLAMEDQQAQWQMFVYDTRRGIWHKETGIHALGFARKDDSLYCIDADTNTLIDLCGLDGEQEKPARWSATSGILGFETPDRKYITRLNLRLRLPKDARLAVYMEYDSDGEWHSCGTIYGAGERTFLFPIRPRRCDHFRLRLDGVGDVRLFFISKVREEGSDGR